MTRYELLQALYHAAELLADENSTGVEVGAYVALAGFHSQDGLVYTVTVSQVEPPKVTGTISKGHGRPEPAPHHGRLN